MRNFLDTVAEKLFHQYGNELSNVTVVFPNHRAGIFFRDALAAIIDRPLLSPQVLTFEDFIFQLSTKKCADKLTLIYTLFDVFSEQTGIRESFDRFYHWGEMLLRDFDEIDSWQVNAADLFSNIHDLKELEARFDYLNKEQIAAINQFWKSFSFISGKQSESQEQFVSLWSKLYGVYEAFRQRLASQYMAYPGMIAREIATLADEYRLDDRHSPLVFVGLNGFTRTEEKIVSWFVKEQQAQVFWDVDALYVEDRQQEAGTYFRRYQQHPVLSATFEQPLPAHFTHNTPKNMQMIATTLEVGQAKKLGELLGELAQQPGYRPEKTVVVLPDEQLLFPVLHSVPSTISRINVTMGYPLQKTSLYSLMEELFTLQQEKKYDESRKSFVYYHSSVVAILKHPYLVQSNPELSVQNVQKLMKNNRVYVRIGDIAGDHPLYPLIFRPVEEMEAMFDYLQAVLLKLNELVQEQEKPSDASIEAVESNEAEAADEQAPKIPDLEQELVYHFYISLNRLKAIMAERGWRLDMPVFFRLFRQVMESLKVPFTGEPLRGLQIMGVLETRNLDFEHVFFLSMNEGIYPPSDTNSSFVPGSLRKGFGLPSQDHQDMLYAYAFFRLLQKAKNVYCFYNTEDTVRLSGEPSRFLYQLMYESDRLEDGRLRFPRGNGNLFIAQQIMAMPVHAIPAPRLTIEKTPEVRKSMARFIKGDKAPVELTPSALNTYLDCRLKFYFKYVAGIKEADTLQEEIDPAVFGNILHKTMELAYLQYQQEKSSPTIDTDAIHVITQKHLNQAMEKAFCQHFQIDPGQAFVFEGKNLIVREIIRKMALRILALDAQYAPFEILGLEKDNYLYNLSVHNAQGQSFTVSLKGIVDRIDRKANVVRVLDYKTGRDEKEVADIASLFDRENPKRNKAAMQAFFYALLYEENEHQHAVGTQIIPGLVNAKNIFQEPFDPQFTMSRQTIGDFTGHHTAFVEGLTGLIEEIFDEQTPFDQTTDQKKCSYCPYASICF